MAESTLHRADELMGHRWMLASDLDGTLVPVPPATGDAQASNDFERALAGRPPPVLVYATGRHLELALDGIGTHALPVPDYLVCDVGTSVYARSDDGWALDEEYRREMAQALGGMEAGEIRDALGATGELRLQEPEKQGAFKASLYVDPDISETEARSLLRERLEAAGASANVVYSRDPATGQGLLDVLPARVGKATAVDRLRRQHGIAVADVVYAGDSGNDVSAFLAGFKAVVVGNAEPSLKDAVAAEAGKRGLERQIYFARAHLVGGVLEGCRHHGLL